MHFWMKTLVNGQSEDSTNKRKEYCEIILSTSTEIASTTLSLSFEVFVLIH